LPWRRTDGGIRQPPAKTRLYDLRKDWTQADDLADKVPARLAELKDRFLIELTKNDGLPVGGALWFPTFHPEFKLAPPYTSWTFPGAITRISEFAAPGSSFQSGTIKGSDPLVR
jgi:arylsulfatase